MNKDAVPPRNLVQICEETPNGFHVEILGNHYCRLRMGYKTECPHLSRDVDHNGLYYCMDVRWYNPDKVILQ
jgi:hypothetical protein